MKRAALIGTIAGAVLVLGGGAAVAASIAASSALDAEPTPSVSISETPVAGPASEATPTPTETTGPLAAQTPSEERNEAAFLAFVRGRLATFPSQIPDATDEQLIETGDVACQRVRSGESVEQMSVIEGEEPGSGGNYYDSNAIIAGAMMHLCPDTLPSDDATQVP